MKQWTRPLRVALQNGNPIVFEDPDQRRFRVRGVVDAWTVVGKWWGMHEQRRRYFSLVTDRGAVIIYHEIPLGAWFACKRYD